MVHAWCCNSVRNALTRRVAGWRPCGTGGGTILPPSPLPPSMPAFSGRSWRTGKTISWRRRVHFIIYRVVRTTEKDEHLTTGCEEDDVMANGTDRHSGNPLTPQ